ncbi:carboxymuconolactone decarboxylase family protein [Glycomyces arizonensis]|uniref:carboxymuconolactone decarboxylase family protein n=1 Tax=Glycomyces arizonensis TaxID=256035 RepID=UPI00316AD33C
MRFYKNMLANEGVLHHGPVPGATLELMKIRASQINGCGFCTDMHVKDAAYAGETPERLALVAAWREAPYYTEAERAALALAEEACRLADRPDGVSDETWDELRKHYDDEQTAVLVAAVAQINAWNRINVTLRNPAGDYDPEVKAKRYRDD